jgi:glutamyl-tRNA synthetase
MPGLKSRAKTLVELADACDFLLSDGPRAPDAKASAAMTADSRARLQRLAAILERTQWEATALEAAMREFSDGEGIKLGDIAQPLRIALTGRTTSPPVFDLLTVLGRDEALTRMRAHAD